MCLVHQAISTPLLFPSSCHIPSSFIYFSHSRLSVFLYSSFSNSFYIPFCPCLPVTSHSHQSLYILFTPTPLTSCALFNSLRPSLALLLLCHPHHHVPFKSPHLLCRLPSFPLVQSPFLFPSIHVLSSLLFLYIFPSVLNTIFLLTLLPPSFSLPFSYYRLPIPSYSLFTSPSLPFSLPSLTFLSLSLCPPLLSLCLIIFHLVSLCTALCGH